MPLIGANGTAIATAYCFPVNCIPPCSDVVGAAVLVIEVVACSLRIYADLAAPSKNLFAMDALLDNLNGRKVGSFYRVGRTISGDENYAVNKYLPRVVEMLETLSAQIRSS